MNTQEMADPGFEQFIQQLSPEDLLEFVSHESNPAALREIVGIRFANEATHSNLDKSWAHTHPFILWGAMNRVFEPWVALTLAKVTLKETQMPLDNLVVIAAPSSATQYLPVISQHQALDSSKFPKVLIEKQLDEDPDFSDLDRNLARMTFVPSYTDNRTTPLDQRVKRPMYFFDPEVYKGSTVIVFDDGLAENETGAHVAWFLKKLGARAIHWSAVMAKQVQGGLEKAANSVTIDQLTTLITVTQTNPVIDFTTKPIYLNGSKNVKV